MTRRLIAVNLIEIEGLGLGYSSNPSWRLMSPTHKVRQHEDGITGHVSRGSQPGIMRSIRGGGEADDREVCLSVS